MLEKIYLFLTLSKDWWSSSQPARCTYNLQPDEPGSFPADVCPDNTSQFGCGPKAKFTHSDTERARANQLNSLRWINKKASLTGADPESSERGPAMLHFCLLRIT